MRLIRIAVLTGSISLLPAPLPAQTGIFTVDGTARGAADHTFVATGIDESAVYVLNSGDLQLITCVLTKTGDSSSLDSSRQYGLNAGLLVTSNGWVWMQNSPVTTNGSGAAGLFATGAGSMVTMTGGAIETFGSGSPGVRTTHGGEISITGADVTTHGAGAPALSTDFAGGALSVTNGYIAATCTAPNSHSYGIHSLGVVTVVYAFVSSSADCGGVIDGPHAISLVNMSLTGALEGIKIWTTTAVPGAATVLLDHSALSGLGGSGVLVTGEGGSAAAAELVLVNGASVTGADGNILRVIEGSSATFSASGSALEGNLRADNTSTMAITLQDASTLTGMIERGALTIAPGSRWTVTSNSAVTELIDHEGVSGLTIGNIVGNGHNVHYDADLPGNAYLNGQVYALVNGGVLTPSTVLAVERRSWGSVKAEYR